MASPKIPWKGLWQTLWKMIPDPQTDLAFRTPKQGSLTNFSFRKNKDIANVTY
jgi:hypothetical protein